MTQPKVFEIGFVGGGKGGHELLGLLASSPFVKVVYVYDIRVDAPAMVDARARGIPALMDLETALCIRTDFVIEATGLFEIQRQLKERFLGTATKVIPNEVAYFLFEVFEENARALRESEWNFKNVIDFLPDPTFVIDLSGRVKIWNLAMERLSGVPSSEMLGKGDYAYATPFYGRPRPVLIDLVLNSGSAETAVYHDFRSSDDILTAESMVRLKEQDIYLMGTAAPLRDSSGKIIGAIESLRDVTVRRQLQAQLVHSEKLASIGTLAAGIGHEINNPLGILQGYLDLSRQALEGSGGLDEEMKENFDGQKTAIDRIKAIINGLRTYARSDTDILENTDIHKVINDTLSLCDFIFKKDGIQIETVLHCDRQILFGNTGKLQQVLMNLLTNARDAILDTRMKQGGSVRIETHNRDGDEIVLRVSDNGAGIAPEKLHRIFDPFYTTKAPGKGTGLGLSVVHSIVESFKGSISAVSEPGFGTTFTVVFPVSLVAPVVATAPNVEEPKSAIPVRVLVADDEPDMRLILVRQLEQFGAVALAVGNGLEALDALRRESFDFVLTDIKMPGMNGDQLILEAKRLGLDCRFVVMTGGIVTEYPKEQRDIFRLHAESYLKKPFAAEELLKVLSRKNPRALV